MFAVLWPIPSEPAHVNKVPQATKEADWKIHPDENVFHVQEALFVELIFNNSGLQLNFLDKIRAVTWTARTNCYKGKTNSSKVCHLQKEVDWKTLENCLTFVNTDSWGPDVKMNEKAREANFWGAEEAIYFRANLGHVWPRKPTTLERDALDRNSTNGTASLPQSHDGSHNDIPIHWEL